MANGFETIPENSSEFRGRIVAGFRMSMKTRRSGATANDTVIKTLIQSPALNTSLRFVPPRIYAGQCLFGGSTNARSWSRFLSQCESTKDTETGVTLRRNGLQS